MKKEVPPSLSRFLISASFYFVFSLMAAFISLAENMKAQFLGFKTGIPPVQDFCYGAGTALTAPLTLLVLFPVLAILGRSRSHMGTTYILITSILSGIVLLNTLLSPVNRQILENNEFDLVAMIQIIMLLVPAAVIYFGIEEIRRRVNR